MARERCLVGLKGLKGEVKVKLKLKSRLCRLEQVTLVRLGGSLRGRWPLRTPLRWVS